MSAIKCWQQDFHRANQLASRIRDYLHDMEQETNSKALPTRRVASCRGLLLELREHVNDLDTSYLKICSMSRTINTSKDTLQDISTQLSNLKRTLSDLQYTYGKFGDSKGFDNIDLTDSHQQAGFGNYDANPFHTALQFNDDPNSRDVARLSQREVAELQERMYDYQELQLDALNDSVQTMKNVTGKIKTELTLQNNIIDGTIDNVNAAQLRISNVNRLLQWSSKKDTSTWFLIILLVILIIVLILVCSLL